MSPTRVEFAGDRSIVGRLVPAPPWDRDGWPHVVWEDDWWTSVMHPDEIVVSLLDSEA